MYQPDSVVSGRVDVVQDANDRRAGVEPGDLPGARRAARPGGRRLAGSQAARLDVLAAIASR